MILLLLLIQIRAIASVFGFCLLSVLLMPVLLYFVQDRENRREMKKKQPKMKMMKMKAM